LEPKSKDLDAIPRKVKICQMNIDTIKKQLPESPNIMGKEEFVNTAVLVSLVQNKGHYHFLFEERASSIRQGGEICFPGGLYQENDKTLNQTAIRETIEELNVDESQIEIIGSMDTLLAPMGVTVDPYIGILHIHDINQLQYDRNEVSRIFMLPVSFFQKNPPEIYQVKLKAHPYEKQKNGETKILLPVKELGLPKRYHQAWGGVPLNVYVYKTPEAMIWGLTAKIVYYFLKVAF
jgi:8-oxo-dGTP pyrophosphatase MutT (NUDIX family)